MAALDLSQVKAVRIADLLEQRDAVRLRGMLERGWQPAQAVGGEGYDRTLMRQVIFDGWTQGWELFRTALPDLLDDFMLWTIALQYGRAPIVADFLAHGMDPRRRGETGLDAVQTLTSSLNRNWKSLPWNQEAGAGSTPEEDEDVAAVADLLKAAGMSLLEVQPGEFAPGDLSSAGHSLWTRAVAQRRWVLAHRVFPASWDEVLAQPRSGEAAQYLRDRASLEPEGPAAALWCRWLESFATPWLAAMPASLDRPTDAPFIRSLSAPSRAAVWGSLGAADEAGWTGLHHVALHGAQPAVIALLACMVADQASCLEAWDKADAGGVSPAELWALALEEVGHPLDTMSPTPAEVLAACMPAPVRPSPCL